VLWPGTRSRVAGAKRPTRDRGPIPSQGLGFVLQWPRKRPLPNRSETTGQRWAPKALDYRVLSEGEFLYRLRPKNGQKNVS
jgi:hypothetical protein